MWFNIQCFFSYAKLIWFRWQRDREREKETNDYVQPQHFIMLKLSKLWLFLILSLRIWSFYYALTMRLNEALCFFMRRVISFIIQYLWERKKNGQFECGKKSQLIRAVEKRFALTHFIFISTKKNGPHIFGQRYEIVRRTEMHSKQMNYEFCIHRLEWTR